MSNRMDRQGARTPAALEQQYKFGKTFAEIEGIATDARRTAEQAQQAYEGLNQEEIFDRLTNKGQWEGFYQDAYGNMYINASYIKSGIINADLIKSGTINADLIRAGRITSQTFEENADGSVNSGMMIDVENGVIVTPFFAVNQAGEVIATGGKIGAWHLKETTIPVNGSENITEYALYSDEMYEEKNGRIYTYRVHMTPRGVYVDGRYDTSNESAVPYYAHKTWLEICGG